MAKDLQDIRMEEAQGRDDLMLTEKFSFSTSLLIKSTSWIRTGEPYLYNFTHLLHILEGEAEYEINLRHYTFRQGDLVIISRDSILRMLRFTDDYRLQVVSLKDAENAAPYCLQVGQCDETSRIAENYFQVIGDALSRGFNDIVIDHLTAALQEEFMVLYKRQVAPEQGTSNNRNLDIFNRFLSLVSQHSHRERTIQFYADRLFLSPRYLSTIIKQVSGRSLMSWVNTSVVNKAKIALQYTDKSIIEISRDLNFNEHTTFTRYFKHLTGMTPSEYRGR